MILWTIQPPEVIDILQNTGVFTCNTSKSENFDDFHDAYLWIASKMDEHDIYHPTGLTLPLWAWHTRNKKHKKPDFRTIGLGTPGERYACIEFEIPDNQVLLSDYDNWHYVLNKSWFDDSQNEKEWDKLHDWFDSLPMETRYKLRKESWNKIFNIEPIENEWYSQGSYIQATFWTLTIDMVRNVKYFTAR